MDTKSPISGESRIVPAFDSAKQIYLKDDLQMRIGLVGEGAERSQFEQSYFKCERRDELLVRMLQRAESAYINQGIQPDSALEPSPMGPQTSYTQQVHKRREEFHARPEIKAFKQRADQKSLSAWRALETRLHAKLKDKQRATLSREDFQNNRSQSKLDIKRSFDRAAR